MPPKSSAARRSRTASVAASTPDASGEVDFTAADFEPSSLRVPELRALLANHSIRLPSSARKADLVKAVQESIIDAHHEAARQREVEVAEERERQREVERLAKEREQVLKREQDEAVEEEANFSTENPFQKATLPDVKPRTKQPRQSLPAVKTEKQRLAARRKTMDPNALATLVHTSTSSASPSPSLNGRQAFQPYIDPTASASTPPRKTQAQAHASPRPQSALRKLPPRIPSRPDSEASTDDESEDAQQPPRRKSSPRSTTSTLATTARWVFGALALAWWVWYVKETKTIGYCDTGAETNALLLQRNASCFTAALDDSDDAAAITLQDILPDALQPSCTPCPAHAVCENGVMASCISSEYILETSMLSALPLLPLRWQASYCRTDSRRLELIDELASEVASRLGAHAGSVICGGKPDLRAVSLVPSSERDAVKYARREQDVFGSLSEDRDPDAISDEYFQHLWDNALDELASSKIVVRRHDGLLVPSPSIAIIPLSCRAKLALQALLKAVSLYILAGLAFVGSVLWARHRLSRARRESRKIGELVDDVVRRLAEQQIIAMDASEPSHLPANHLRDLLLPSGAWSKAARKRVWTTVANRVESNSNVRTGMKRWKGEYSRAWEWVGVSTAPTRSAPATPAAASGSNTPRSETIIVHDDVDSSDGDASIARDKGAAGV